MILVVVAVVVLAFFLLPFVPISSSRSSAFGVANESYTADASPSFALLDCGYVLNPTTGVSFGGHQVGQSIAPTGFYCQIAPSSGK
jgi:hypothetical protein